MRIPQLMAKIKKIYKYTLLLFIILVIVPLIAFFTLKIPSVQSYLGKKFTENISSKIEGTIEFEHIHFTYFNNVKINNLLIRDFSEDTLIYSPSVEIGIKKFKKSERLLKLGKINIEEPIIKLKPDTTGNLNLLYYIDFIIPEDTAQRVKELSITQLKVTDGILSYNSGKSSLTKAGLIDPGNIKIDDLNITIDDLEKIWSDISLNIKEFSFINDNGFELTNLFAEIDIGDNHINLLDPTIRTSNSIINSDILGISFDPGDKKLDIMKDASLNFRFNSSLVSLKDLGYFVEKLKGYDKEFMLSGRFRGTLAELKGRDLQIRHSDTTKLLFDFDMSGLPDIDNTFMFIDIEELTTHTSEIESINIPKKGFIDLGNEVRRLGKLSFSGNFTGFITDFVTYGKFTTDLGKLSTDILFKPDTSNSFVYSGSLDINELDLGKLSNQASILGRTSASFEVDGYSESFDRFRANVKGKIDSLGFNNYCYRDINLDAVVTERIFDGSLTSNTEDLRMDMLGRFDLSNTIPEMDFSINLLYADLFALNIDPNDSTSNLSMLLTANILGNKVDNLTGEVRMLNSRLSKFGEELEIYDARLNASKNEDKYKLKLQSDFINAEISGDYKVSDIGKDLKKILYTLAPSFAESERSTIDTSENRFSYSLQFKESDKLNNFFKTGFRIAPGTSIYGDVSPDDNISVFMKSDYLAYLNSSIIDFKLDAELIDSTLSLDFESYKANLVSRIDIDSIKLNINTIPDSLRLNIDWLGSSNKEHGKISMGGSFGKSLSGKPKFNAVFLPSEIDIKDKTWTVEESRIVFDSSFVSVDKFRLYNNNRYILVDGNVSENLNDTLFVSFNQLDLTILNSIKKQDAETKEDKIEFIVEGKLNGEVLLTNLYNSLMFESDILVEDFKTNEHEHGNVSLISDWNTSMQRADIDISNNNKGNQTFGINGYYDPENSNLNLFTEINKMPLDILNLVLYNFASGVKGFGSGSVLISGEPSAPKISGSVMAEDASMVIDYLQTRFMFSDSIQLKDYSYVFDSIEITDDRGNRAILDGYVAHDAYNDFDIELRIDANELLVLDTKQKDNDLFFGTAFASGIINIIGKDNELDLNISAITEKNTRVFFPLIQGDQVSDYSFISFAKPRSDTMARKEINLPISLPEPNSKLGINFNLDVTQDAEIQLVFDASIGDVLRSTGTGTMNMTVDKDGSFEMFGNYTIEDGDYQLTLGNIFNKRFIVEEGGSITWNGDITDAAIDLKAIYKLKASLYELLLNPDYKERIPVECHLNMSGQLVNPVIGFDIYLPTADERMRTDLRNAINSDEEMSRQFLYLLVMNSFYPDPSFAGATGATSSGASAMGVTTTEMLSNQLSNWLSQISNDFDIGFAYRPGNEISSQEVEVALSTQLLDDKVIINGNFAVAGQETSSTMNDLTGDFDVEVKLTEKLRLKVFNRSNDNLYYETAPYTQGFGFFFRQEFNKFRDILRRKNKDIKKKDDIKAVDN